MESSENIKWLYATLNTAELFRLQDVLVEAQVHVPLHIAAAVKLENPLKLCISTPENQNSVQKDISSYSGSCIQFSLQDYQHYMKATEVFWKLTQ